MNLPYDYSRCQGWECSKRETCARYTNLGNLGPRTPVMQRMCDYDVPSADQAHFIDVAESGGSNASHR